ncbi:mechanosensitive ion channel family protein [Quadrisphaera sp. GCM10027208]|uniref:mechanosensitive ion channel family protein n=1 Tax=Quadrisphaera sp. GCM10027208 TaxID=3273423 RepID=UPI0036221549
MHSSFTPALAASASPATGPSVPPSVEPSPTPTETGGLLERVDPESTPCRVEDGSFCGVLYDWTGNQDLSRWVSGILGTLASILLIVLVGLVLRWLLHRGITRLTDRIVEGATAPGGAPQRGRSGRRSSATALLESPLTGERRVQRAQTIGSVLKSISTGVVGVVVVLMVLSELSINVGPLIAGAGIVGVALGFGSQTLVKDFLSGMFMIVEDQYGVGDVVDVGEANGTVEAVGLRVTRLRDVSGTVWYVPNGEILRVGNMSQGWARAVLDVAVAYGEDVGRVQDLLRQVGAELAADADWGPLVLEEPEVWGVEALAADSVVVRLVVKTAPLQQWGVARELRRRIKARFDREGIEIPFPQRTVWMRTQDDGRRGGSEQERHEQPPGGESKVAQEIEPRNDSGL